MNVAIEKIQMLGNRILIKPDPAKVHEIITAGGLVTASGREIKSDNGIQHFEDKEPPTGIVIAIGPDVKTMDVGDRILFSPFSGKKLTFMLEDYLLMSEPEPVMIITK